jgi:hypothetical protein
MRYRVRRGDTLNEIARAARISPDRLLAANPSITNPDLIHAGANLTLPSPHIGALDPIDPTERRRRLAARARRRRSSVDIQPAEDFVDAEPMGGAEARSGLGPRGARILAGAAGLGAGASPSASPSPDPAILALAGGEDMRYRGWDDPSVSDMESFGWPRVRRDGSMPGDTATRGGSPGNFGMGPGRAQAVIDDVLEGVEQRSVFGVPTGVPPRTLGAAIATGLTAGGAMAGAPLVSSAMGAGAAEGAGASIFGDALSGETPSIGRAAGGALLGGAAGGLIGRAAGPLARRLASRVPSSEAQASRAIQQMGTPAAPAPSPAAPSPPPPAPSPGAAPPQNRFGVPAVPGPRPRGQPAMPSSAGPQAMRNRTVSERPVSPGVGPDGPGVGVDDTQSYMRLRPPTPPPPSPPTSPSLTSPTMPQPSFVREPWALQLGPSGAPPSAGAPPALPMPPQRAMTPSPMPSPRAALPASPQGSAGLSALPSDMLGGVPPPGQLPSQMMPTSMPPLGAPPMPSVPDRSAAAVAASMARRRAARPSSPLPPPPAAGPPPDMFGGGTVLGEGTNPRLPLGMVGSPPRVGPPVNRGRPEPAMTPTFDRTTFGPTAGPEYTPPPINAEDAAYARAAARPESLGDVPSIPDPSPRQSVRVPAMPPQGLARQALGRRLGLNIQGPIPPVERLPPGPSVLRSGLTGEPESPLTATSIRPPAQLSGATRSGRARAAPGGDSHPAYDDPELVEHIRRFARERITPPSDVMPMMPPSVRMAASARPPAVGNQAGLSALPPEMAERLQQAMASGDPTAAMAIIGEMSPEMQAQAVRAMVRARVTELEAAGDMAAAQRLAATLE